MEEIFFESIKTSLLDKNIKSNEKYQHKILCNKDEKIIIDIRKELENCDEFIISVAFITEGGLALILEQLKILEERGIKGKILTGDYLNFTEPKALKRILKYKNIELKILFGEKFHAKGYFFRKENIWTMIVGSSNLTQKALTVNFELNLKINSMEKGNILDSFLKNFIKIFDNLPKIDENIIENYEREYKKIKEYEKELKKIKNIGKEEKIIPNFMQEKALKNLKKLREKENKALLISATGTGKTYLAAFDVKNAKPCKVLFIAHRKTILQKAKETFENIIKNKSMTILGEEKISKGDFIFAMVQTLTKDIHLQKFEPYEFDYIIIDEVHHSGAKSYQKVIDYFKPKFFLGMTATPERSDDFDIYKLFNHNIAYEIRLYDALRENLLCPFHYFGVSDIIIDGEFINEKTTINKLVIDKRVDHIIEKSKYYGYSGDVLHGLIFVSRKEEAKILSEKFNKKGIKTDFLIGDDSDTKREKTIESLEKGEISYIITVDIFNEGVDIPCVNQIILLRPTESSIVYIQQLGRGLRKFENKKFVLILDFIGNYEKNFLIPIAISQNNNFDKDFMKRFIMNGTNMIPGESSIVFEEIVKERIFENIGKANFSTKKNIEHDFNLLEKQLGRIPMLYDFFEKNMIEPSMILKYKKNYDEVLKILRPKENFPILLEKEKNYLTFLSGFFTPAKRIHENLILKEILEKKSILEDEIENIILKKYNLKNQRLSIENAFSHLSKEIFTSLSTIKEFEPLLIAKIINKNKIYEISREFYESYQNNKYFKSLIDDLIKYNLSYVEKNYKQTGEETILRYKEYTKQEGFWNLNFDFNNGYQVSGYTVFEKEKKVVLFITLEDKDPFSNYKNNFIDSYRFPWFSKSNRCIKRNNILTAEGKIAKNYYTLFAFAKKKSGEKFYYLGEIEKVLNYEEIIGKRGESLVRYELKLKYEIEKNLLEYLDK